VIVDAERGYVLTLGWLRSIIPAATANPSRRAFEVAGEDAHLRRAVGGKTASRPNMELYS